MKDEYLTLEAAAQQSGLHPNTVRRLLREGVLRGYKTGHRGKQRWLVSSASLRAYTDPMQGFLLDLPGPKLFLSRRANEVGEDERD
jgi:excisionase family DNA binding protein